MKHLFVVLFICCGQLIAQGKPQAFRINMDRVDVIASFGEPRHYLMSRMIFPRYPEVVTGLVWEVYSRKTAANEYQISVLYRRDAARSRLHPTLRVQEVRIKLDREQPIEKALADLPEAAAVCTPSCSARVSQINGSFVMVPTKGLAKLTLSYEGADGLDKPIEKARGLISDITIDELSDFDLENSKPTNLQWNTSPA